MRTTLADLWDKLRTSLWFVPALMALASAFLALLLVRAQEWVADEWMYETRWLATGDPEGARQILATIAGSIITVTGVIFSVTLVALSLASQQFGPRLLRTFMRDRGNQIVLGTFIGTFIYAMLVLRVVQENDDGVPYLAVTFAVGLALVALAVLIFFIHHVVASIQADSIILHVSHELHETMHAMYPELAKDWGDDDAAAGEVSDLPPPWHVTAAKTGYVRALAVDGLLELAEEHDIVIHATQRPGRFVIDGQTIAHVYTDAALDGHARKAIEHHIRRAVLIGPNRTAEQDIEFSIAQLVEIAVRSLSPSLNDPFTAMTCLDRLGEAIAHLGRRSLPKTERVKSDGKLRLLIDRPDFSGMVHLAFDQIRQNGRGKPAVVIHMLDVLCTVIQELTERPSCIGPLLHQARMIRNAAKETGLDEYDKEVIAQRFADAARAAAGVAGQ